MSSMIVELISEISAHLWRGKWDAYQKILLPDPAVKPEKNVRHHDGQDKERSARLPRIHNREPFLFHSSNVLPWVNHFAVPSWWVSQATL
jgi:hypothetical protein